MYIVFYSACKCIQISGIMPSMLAPGTVSLTGNRVQGDNSKHSAYCTLQVGLIYTAEVTLCLQLLSADNLCKQFKPDQDRQNVRPDLDPNCLSL